MKIIYSIYHFLWAFSGSLFYRNPSKDIFVIGVTGTKGKSTTLELIKSVLEEDNNKVAVMSSIRNKTPNTMPGRWEMQKFLKKAVSKNCDYALIEVTSQGVVQHRHKFIDWDGAVFLNLHPEHIEAHGSYEKYKQAKLDFFRYLKKSNKDKKYFFVNKDDKEADDFAGTAKSIKNYQLIYFSSNDVLKITNKIKEEKDPDWLKADFNLVNASAAMSVGIAKSVKIEKIKKAFESFDGVEGRVEYIQHKPFNVVVDYAHTPDSLKELYKNLRNSKDFTQDSKLICVLGSAGGGRDKWKRPEFGKIAASYCDTIILTSEDPYDEDPELIIEDIIKGINKDGDNNKVIKEIDRKKALKKALSLASEGDIVVSTGMGSQKWFYSKNNKIPWKESKIIKDLLKN
ncbi:MAG: UDP-N-acetylmuramyl-tripeptide synthetase [Candidatus Paceibacterota bacterium]